MPASTQHRGMNMSERMLLQHSQEQLNTPNRLPRPSNSYPNTFDIDVDLVAQHHTNNLNRFPQPFNAYQNMYAPGTATLHRTQATGSSSQSNLGQSLVTNCLAITAPYRVARDTQPAEMNAKVAIAPNRGRLRGGRLGWVARRRNATAKKARESDREESSRED